MHVSERRKKILEIFETKGSVGYREILDEMSEFDDPINILSDIDTLVFFEFLQNIGVKRAELTAETKLELTQETRKQINDNPSRIDSRLKELEHEVPPWYRKRVILTILDRRMSGDEINEGIQEQHQTKWSLLLVEASLGILVDSDYVSRKREKEKNRVTYILSSEGESLLREPPLHQFLTLRNLKSDFSSEFRTYEILRLVVDYKCISSGEIIRHLQSKYGIRGNKSRAIRNTLNKMVFSGLLRVRGGTELKEGHMYSLGETVESLFSGKVEIMYHDIGDFKKTIEQFFEKYKIDKDVQSTIKRALDDIDQCKEDISQKSPDYWINHIIALSGYLHGETNVWEKKMVQSISACILSRLLPPTITIEVLKDYPVPHPPSEKEYIYYNGIAREHYFNLTEAYLSLDEREKAFQCFGCLNVLVWESPDFWVLKGRLEMLRWDIRKHNEFQHVIAPFKKALEKSSGKERIGALFYVGLIQYQRGDLKEAEKAWKECLDSVGSVYWKTTLYHNLANIYWLSGELEKARTYYTASVDFSNPLPEMDEPADVSLFYELRAKSLLGLTNVLIDSGSWDEADEKLKQIIQESTEKQVPLITAIAKTNLGDLLNRRKAYEEALFCHQEALELVDEERNPREYGIILINLGNTLRLLRRVEEARNAFEKARTLISTENSILIQNLNISEADLYIDMGDLEKSWELSHAVLQENWIDNSRPGAGAYRIRGKIHLRRKDFQKANEALRKSEEILSTLKLQYELLEVHELLELCSKNLNDGRKALYRTER